MEEHDLWGRSRKQNVRIRALSKNEYKRAPLETKKTRQGFRGLVDTSLKRQLVTTERVRLFSKRARYYMQAYMALHQEVEEEEENQATEDEPSEIPFEDLGNHRLLVQERYKASRAKQQKTGSRKKMITHVEIERAMRKFRTHRCVLDFDSKFVKMVIKTTEDEKFMATNKKGVITVDDSSQSEVDVGDDVFVLPSDDSSSSSDSETEDEKSTEMDTNED